MNEIICPACGGDSIKNDSKQKIVKEPFGGSAKIQISNYSCQTCGFSGDFLKENDQALQECINSLKGDAAENILDDLLTHDYSFASIERALEIPQRTLSKWKSKSCKPSAAGLSLLKFLRLFPWLIEVAENKFDYSTSQKIHVFDAFKQTLDQMSFNENGFSKMGTKATFEFVRIQIETQQDNIQDCDYDFNSDPTTPIIECATI